MLKIEANRDENGVLSKIEIKGGLDEILNELVYSTYSCLTKMAEDVVEANAELKLEKCKNVIQREYLNNLIKLFANEQPVHELKHKFYVDKNGEVHHL